MKARFVWLYCDCTDNEKAFGGRRNMCVCAEAFVTTKQSDAVHLFGSSLSKNEESNYFLIFLFFIEV